MTTIFEASDPNAGVPMRHDGTSDCLAGPRWRHLGAAKIAVLKPSRLLKPEASLAKFDVHHPPVVAELATRHLGHVLGLQVKVLRGGTHHLDRRRSQRHLGLGLG
jgi:hypothetical protein